MKDLKFKDLIAKYKALPVKTKNLIFVVLGIAIFIGSYMLGYQKLNESTAAINEEITTQSQRVAELKGYYDNITTYETGIAESKATISDCLSRLPLGIEEEDFLMYVKTMNEDLGVEFLNLSFGGDTTIGEFGCTVEDEKGAMKQVNATAMSTSVSYSCNMTYDQFKEFFDYLYEDTKQVTFIDSISLAYDAESASLSSSIAISKFYLTYEGANYVPVEVPDVSLGVSDPFDTD